MSDNEVEKFEITDYDLEHEFSQHRPGRRQTKEQQIYGMWAQESGGEEVSLIQNNCYKAQDSFVTIQNIHQHELECRASFN